MPRLHLNLLKIKKQRKLNKFTHYHKTLATAKGFIFGCYAKRRV